MLSQIIDHIEHREPSRLTRVSGYIILIMCAVFIAQMLYYRSLTYLRHADIDRGALWMAAAKGFEGRLTYVGSEGDYSFFRAGKVFIRRYKTPTSTTHLPRTFPLGAEEPYDVDADMVPRYP